MKKAVMHQDRLPIQPSTLLISLVGATVTLIVIYILRRMALISTETAIWAAVGVFVVAAIIEMVLFSVITLYMIHKPDKDSPVNTKNIGKRGQRK